MLKRQSLQIINLLGTQKKSDNLLERLDECMLLIDQRNGEIKEKNETIQGKLSCDCFDRLKRGISFCRCHDRQSVLKCFRARGAGWCRSQQGCCTHRLLLEDVIRRTGAGRDNPPRHSKYCGSGIARNACACILSRDYFGLAIAGQHLPAEDTTAYPRSSYIRKSVC